MFKFFKAWKYGSTFLRAKSYCSEKKYTQALETLNKVDVNELNDKSLVKYLLLEAHVLFQLKRVDSSRELFVKAEENIEGSSRLNEHEKNYLFNYINEHFESLAKAGDRSKVYLGSVDDKLKSTFPVNNA